MSGINPENLTDLTPNVAQKINMQLAMLSRSVKLTIK